MDQGSGGALRIGRRRFLKAALSTAAVLSAGRSIAQTRAAPAQNSETILVVGAGLAGLVAAYRLREAGKRVIVIEARAVPGGRVRTVRDFADGLYGELGAARIADTHNYALHWVNELGLSLTPFQPTGEATVLSVNGMRARSDDNEAIARLTDKLNPDERGLTPPQLLVKYITGLPEELAQPEFRSARAALGRHRPHELGPVAAFARRVGGRAPADDARRAFIAALGALSAAPDHAASRFGRVSEDRGRLRSDRAPVGEPRSGHPLQLRADAARPVGADPRHRAIRRPRGDHHRRPRGARRFPSRCCGTSGSIRHSRRRRRRSSAISATTRAPASCCRRAPASGRRPSSRAEREPTGRRTSGTWALAYPATAGFLSATTGGHEVEAKLRRCPARTAQPMASPWSRPHFLRLSRK